jgi:virulence factor Mce-like protein
MSSVRAGALLIAIAVVVTYFGFAKDVPFTHGFRLQGVFETANNVRPGSPVRVAGVDVGKVKKVERAGAGHAAIVTMEIADEGLPIHRDATLKIRPRIFLEGNFFVDLKPGSPGQPELDDGDRVPITQTSAPVQLDQVLTSLQSDTREDLQTLIQEYGEALTHRPTPAEDRGQDADVRGEAAAQALNDSLGYGGPALRDLSIVNQAMLGTRAGDLPETIEGLGAVAEALSRDEAALQGLIVNLNLTTAAFASESERLRASIRLLAPTLRIANRTFADLNRAFPAARAFSREILPGVRETPATIAASFPWIRQVRALLGPAELGGLARELRPTTAALARVTDDSIRLLPQVDLINRCAIEVVLPTGNVKIEDGFLSSGAENYKEFWYAMVGLAGEGQNFDGNGMYVRFQPGGGNQMVSTGRGSVSGDRLFGNAVAKPLGTRPAFPGRRPPYRPDVPCHTQRVPDLNGAATGAAEQPVTPSSARAPRRGPAGTSVVDELAKRLNPFSKLEAGR